MKKMIFSAALLLLSAVGFAEEPVAKPVVQSATEKSEWLPSFTTIAVDATLDIVLVKVPDTEAPKIIYDTKGSYTTKFRAEVKDHVLRISERSDARRPERTQVKVFYNELQQITINYASAVFDSPLDMAMLDMTVGGDARVEARLDVKDLKLELTGHCKVLFSGSVRFLSLALSTGKFDASKLEVMSADVNASGSSTASLWVTERLVAKTSTGAKITYKGSPEIVRGASKFMGGDISHVE